MKKKFLLCTISSLLLGLIACPKPVHALRCELWDLLNAAVTPLPTSDGETNMSTMFANLQQLIQTAKSITESGEYGDKLMKLSENPSSLAKNIPQIKVPELESVTKGTQTIVDAYKGMATDVLTPSVDFENSQQIDQAVTNAAVVANPVGNVEEQVAKERKNAYIQQATIDLFSDLLVAKKKLAELKESDTSSQQMPQKGSSDTAGVIKSVAQMKDYENQIQALEQKMQAMFSLREGIASLKSADTVKEQINVGG